LTVSDAPHAETHGEHDIWEHMTPDMRAELKAEDSDAWKHVVGVLLLIISIGLVLAVFTAAMSGLLTSTL
jgi:hypothetical protein